MYSLSSYGLMMADRVRMEAYAEALRRSVRPGAVVVDIGTGAGVLAMLACRFGAGKVLAIEPSDAIEVGREIARANGFADRIEFIQELSTRVKLEVPADVIVSDLRGVLPLFRGHLMDIVDARTRWLAPGGQLIPQSDSMWAAPVEAPELYNPQVGPWVENPWGFDMRAARPLLTNTWYKGRPKHESLLAQPGCWAVLAYRSIQKADVHGEVSAAVQRAGLAHGWCVWFDAELIEGVGFSNAPHQPEAIYGSAFFPWLEPVPLAVGDSVVGAFHADLVDNAYVWRWETRVLDQAREGSLKAHFKQSSFFGDPLSPARLKKISAAYVPTLSREGEANRLILNLIDGGATLAEIARRVQEAFPGVFTGRQDALGRVSELSLRYSR